MLSNRIKKLPISATLEMASKTRELKEKGIDVIGLSLGEPDFNTPDFIKNAAVNAINENYNSYTPVDGYHDLKKSICKKFLRDNDISYEPNQIVVSTGAKQSIANAIQVLINPGDDVLLAAPYWVSYSAMVKLAEGNPIEIYYEPTLDYKFLSPIPNQTFVASHLGLGHLMILASNREQTYDFYTKILGFKLTDYISFDGGDGAWFMRCNPRHHSMALSKFGEANGMHHIMFQVDSIDSVGRALDRINAAGVEISSTLGKHINDLTTSVYIKGPNGWDIEIGADTVNIHDDDKWIPKQFVEGDIWGHHGIMDSIAEVSADLKENAEDGKN